MRGQSAIEYLMTYGWAILALVIVIGILVGTGVLSPTYLISEECSLGSNLPCTTALYNSGGETHIAVGVFNSFPYKIKVARLHVFGTSGSTEFSGFSSDAYLDSGANFTFNGTLAGTSLAPNSIQRFFANLTYVSCAPEVAVTPGGCSDSEHSIVGRITNKVIPE